jgi:CheY-like chemotaxis protein
MVPPPAQKPRVLYSEDDPDARELMSLILESEGFETICSDSPQDALRLSREEKFSVYLLDTWTPGMSGVDLCRKIREYDTDTPIVFYSAAVYQHDIDAAFAAGAQAYIKKPSRLEDVVDAIRSTISSPRPKET